MCGLRRNLLSFPYFCLSVRTHLLRLLQLSPIRTLLLRSFAKWRDGRTFERKRERDGKGIGATKECGRLSGREGVTFEGFCWGLGECSTVHRQSTVIGRLLSIEFFFPASQASLEADVILLLFWVFRFRALHLLLLPIRIRIFVKSSSSFSSFSSLLASSMPPPGSG